MKNESDVWGIEGWTEALIRVIRVLAATGFTDKFLAMKKDWDERTEGDIQVQAKNWIEYAKALGLKNYDSGNYVVSRCEFELVLLVPARSLGPCRKLEPCEDHPR